MVWGQNPDIHSTSSSDQGILAVAIQTQGFLFPDLLVERESGLESGNHKVLRGRRELRRNPTLSDKVNEA